MIYIGSRFVNLFGNGNVGQGPMSLATGRAPATFSDRVLRLLERVEHRIALAPAEREAAFKLRFDAYQKIGLLQQRNEERLYDPRFDDAPSRPLKKSLASGIVM
jgi:hypothetical protein